MYLFKSNMSIQLIECVIFKCFPFMLLVIIILDIVLKFESDIKIKLPPWLGDIRNDDMQ